MRCNCESSYCPHHNTPNPDSPFGTDCKACPNDATDGMDMAYVGEVCKACADANKASGYIYPRGTVR